MPGQLKSNANQAQREKIHKMLTHLREMAVQVLVEISKTYNFKPWMIREDKNPKFMFCSKILSNPNPPNSNWESMEDLILKLKILNPPMTYDEMETFIKVNSIKSNSDSKKKSKIPTLIPNSRARRRNPISIVSIKTPLAGRNNENYTRCDNKNQIKTLIDDIMQNFLNGTYAARVSMVYSVAETSKSYGFIAGHTFMLVNRDDGLWLMDITDKRKFHGKGVDNYWNIINSVAKQLDKPLKINKFPDKSLLVELEEKHGGKFPCMQYTDYHLSPLILDGTWKYEAELTFPDGVSR